MQKTTWTINQNAFLFEKGISDCRQNRYGFVYFVLGCLRCNLNL
nr:MAG TPA: hypothetical protein [Caudoviricetes sp.]